MKRLHTVLLTFYLLFTSLVIQENVYAIMPPHIAKVSGIIDGELRGNKISLTGYSLGIIKAEQNMAILDESRNKASFESKMSCFMIGEGTLPGQRQQRCKILIEVDKLVPYKKYRLIILGVDGGDISFIYKPRKSE